MASLEKKHLVQIQSYLDQQGLTFKPLREEMTDHLMGDLQAHISNGLPFDEAWVQITGEIPDKHLKNIQQEVMETINKKFSLSRGFTYLSLVLISAMIIFKIFHMSLSAILLLAAFGSIGASLFVGTVFSLYPFKNKIESMLLLGAVIGIELFLLSFFTQIKHLPGFIALRNTSVLMLLIFFPLIALYLGQKENTEGHILNHIHKKHSPGIERFLIILLSMATVLRFVSITFESRPDVSHVLLVLVIGGAGLQFFALNWKHASRPPWWFQAVLILAFACFVLPNLNVSLSDPVFSKEGRLILMGSFLLLAGAIVLYQSRDIPFKNVLLSLVTLFSLAYIMWLLTIMGGLSSQYVQIAFNIPGLLILLSGLIFFFKEPLPKVYLILVIAYYMWEYPIALGLY